MEQVVVTSSYRVTIPKAARERAGFAVGQRLAVVARGRTIMLVPVTPIAELRGFVGELDAGGLRGNVERSGAGAGDARDRAALAGLPGVTYYPK